MLFTAATRLLQPPPGRNVQPFTNIPHNQQPSEAGQPSVELWSSGNWDSLGKSVVIQPVAPPLTERPDLLSLACWTRLPVGY